MAIFFKILCFVVVLFLVLPLFFLEEESKYWSWRKKEERGRKGEKKLGVSTDKSDRHGGLEHRYWCNNLAGHLRNHGHKVAEEFPVGGGKTIDLVATRDGKRIAFEIETGKSDAAANVRKCLAAGIDKVVVVATTPTVRNDLAKTVASPPKVELLTAGEAVRQGCW